jgi:6-phosphofructokinase
MVYLQSGGPTAVINCSLYGAIVEAKKHPEIGGIYGSLNGIEGLINDDLIDLRAERMKRSNSLSRLRAPSRHHPFQDAGGFRSGTLRQSLRNRESPQHRLHLRQWRQRLDGHLR